MSKKSNKSSVPEFVYDKSKIRAIIGLGNPGAKYYKTRHSIGFRIIDELAKTLYAEWQMSHDMEHAQVKLSLDPYASEDLAPVHFVKPLTYMNNSGKVLSYLLKKGIKPDQILVIHDELEKSFGHIRVKFGGSAKGHNGLRSIIDRIGKDFWRLPFGIGRPEDKSQVGDYVLKPFVPEEEKELGSLVGQAVRLVLG